MATAALICATVCSACQKATELRDISTNLAQRKWVALQHNIRTGEGKDYTLELVPEGSTKSNWQEIVTVQYFWTGKKTVPLSSVETEIIKNMSVPTGTKKSGADRFYKEASDFLAELFGNKPEVQPERKREITHRVLSESPKELLFTWQANNDPDLQNQQGLVRVAGARDGIEVLQFTSKTPLPDKQVQHWQKLLAESELQSLVR